MTEPRQPQDADDQRLTGGEPVGQADEEQAQREELDYGDSSTAVSPDTQRSDRGAADEDRNPDQGDVSGAEVVHEARARQAEG